MKKLLHKPKNPNSILRFSPTAWSKLRFMRDMSENEVGGFGITETDDLLLVTDFVLVKQKVTCISVAFDDISVGDFFEDQAQAGRKPEQFARIWLHTHPGNSPQPSSTDESTFARVFGSCDWSVMAIVAQDNSTYAILRFNTGPGGKIKIPVCVDYSYPFRSSDFELWRQQYLTNVIEDFSFMRKPDELKISVPEISATRHTLSHHDILQEIEQMDPIERQIFMDELAVRDFWGDYESEGIYEQ